MTEEQCQWFVENRWALTSIIRSSRDTQIRKIVALETLIEELKAENQYLRVLLGYQPE